ncbi:hypothetical protein K9L67_01090 [Candidatus Woesearchaeota archaeon]|nr:hypothetical protein [Candidatus Woesearchaeota archaeon]MCF7900799.1 hypothetical protein [Candidatus Woesearchaeota archaeon]MCF8013101.1 hypothetical protein [Candidatus Woesearchaeota archaeon]
MARIILGDSTFYVLLIALLLVSAACAYILIPILLFLGWFGYFVTGILGLTLGVFINHFVQNLDDFTKHHHAGVWFVIIFGSLLNFSVIYVSVPVNIYSYAFSAGLLFAICFLIPNLLSHIFVKKGPI